MEPMKPMESMKPITGGLTISASRPRVGRRTGFSTHSFPGSVTC
jgi:hypothetical protein